MIDGFPVNSPWTLGSLLGLCVILVIFGGLIPRWTHNQRINDKREIIDFLKDSLKKRDEQVEKLISQGEVTVKLLEDIKQSSQANREAARQ